MPRTTIDISEALRDDIKAIAKEEHRSMRKQIAYWLQIMVMRHKAKEADWVGYDGGEVECDESDT